tara:strand:+ start:871 stop:1122 length:252 start_codon:yes stop_codon:yes gene_type:complete
MLEQQNIIDRLEKQIRVLQLDLRTERLQSQWLDALATFNGDVNYEQWEQEDIDEGRNQVELLYQQYKNRLNEVYTIKKELGLN